jgi:phage shock protein C
MSDPAPGPNAPPPSETRALRRTRDPRVVAGVCGGLARYLGLDIVLVRIVFVVLAVFGGSGVVLYLIGWIAIPEERPGDRVEGPAAGLGSGSAQVVIGALLIVVGFLLLFDHVMPGFRQVLGPLVLIAIGVGLIVRMRR